MHLSIPSMEVLPPTLLFFIKGGSYGVKSMCFRWLKGQKYILVTTSGGREKESVALEIIFK